MTRLRFDRRLSPEGAAALGFKHGRRGMPPEHGVRPKRHYDAGYVEGVEFARTNPIAPRAAIIIGVLFGIGAGLISFFLFKDTASSDQPSATSKPRRFALIGDSLAVGLAPQLKKLFSDRGIDFAVEAHSGTNTAQWTTSASACGRCFNWLAAFNPTDVIAVLGTNDGSAPNAANYAAIRDRIKAVGTNVNVIWVQPNKMTKYALTNVRAVIDNLNDVDVVPAFNAPISSDGVHPSNYSAWASFIFDHVMNQTKTLAGVLGRTTK